MGDEKEGPYKVVAKLSKDPRKPAEYSIVVQQKNDLFQRELVPDAGTGDTARQLVNLLNRNYREVVRGLETGEGWGTKGLEGLGGNEAERSAG